MSGFLRCCRALDQVFGSISYITGKLVAWLTLMMALATTATVLSRTFLREGSVALQESVTYMHAIVLMVTAAYTLRHDGHVRVDIFYRRYSPVQKAWTDALGSLLFLLPFCVFTLAISWQYVANAWAIGEVSIDAGGLPAVFLLKTLILVYAGLLALQGLADLARNLIILTVRDDHG
jgi:TRAP-type mannitol/chloroaromatic compound transport system permease small subunit